MDGSKRSLLALRHTLQLFEVCLNKPHRGWDKITVLHAGCDLHQGVLCHVCPISDIIIGLTLLSIFAVHIGTTRRIRLNSPCVVAMRLYVTLL